MKINYSKILEIHGLEIFNLIRNNIKIVIFNLNYLNLLGFEDPEEILEKYPQIFICQKKEFKEKINLFIKNIGSDYIEILNNDIGLWEGLLW